MKIQVWYLRRGDKTNFVRTTPDGLFVYVNGTNIFLDRRTARLLARRINECLDATTRPSP